MPTRGRKPKPPGQAVNRNATLDFVEVPNVRFGGAPKLPATRANGEPWSVRGRAKWRAWSSMPHCVLWEAEDWQFAFDTIEVAERFLATDDPRAGAELRNREKVMGTTFDYRRDIRVRFVDPVEDNPDVAKLDDYRAL